MDKQYCIMDMDGTLVDSMSYWDRLSPEYLLSRGIDEDTDELMERIKTMTMPEACALLKQTFDLPESPQEISDELGEVYFPAGIAVFLVAHGPYYVQYRGDQVYRDDVDDHDRLRLVYQHGHEYAEVEKEESYE